MHVRLLIIIVQYADLRRHQSEAPIYDKHLFCCIYHQKQGGRND